MKPPVPKGDGPFPLEGAEQPADPVESFRMPLMEHLKELRKRLIVVLVATGVAMGGCFVFVQEILAKAVIFKFFQGSIRIGKNAVGPVMPKNRR